MTLRTRIFVIVSIAVLFVLGISLLLYVRGKKPAVVKTSVPSQSTGQTSNQPAAGLTPSTTAGQNLVPVKQLSTEEQIKNAVRQWAKIFIERYGSYSNDNSGQNILDVQELASPDLWSVISKRINYAPAGGAFTGVSTRVVNTTIVDWSDSRAVIDLKTMRLENNNNILTDRQHDVRVVMIKIGDDWKADDFKWGK